MKILLLAKAYPPETGGVETYSEQVATAYERAGHTVTVLTAHPGPLGTAARGTISVVNVGQHGGQPAVFARMLKHLWSIRKKTFAVVHATTWRAALPALFLRRSLPLVVTIHGREVFVVPTPLRPLMHMVLKHGRHFPTVSQIILEKFEDDLGYKLEGAFANWNGVSFETACTEPRQEEDADTSKLEIFCMCRQVPRKNLDGAIRAAATLVECGNRLRFRIAGSGPENKRLHALVDELGMGEHIHLLGRVDDEEIIPLYRSSHVFLHPQIATRGGQDMEGFGLTIADAMSFGCVPIAGASGGPLDFIEHGTSGFLVDGTRQNEIIDALTTLVSDPERRKSIGLTAQAFAQKEITWDMHVTKIIDRLNTDLR